MSAFERGPQIARSPEGTGSPSRDSQEAQERFPLYDYQKTASKKTLDALKKDGRALIDMATGLGKTRTVIDVIEKTNARRILVLADTKRLLRDHKRTFDTYLSPSHNIGFYIGEDKKGKDCDIVFATRQSMREHMREFSPERFDMVVDDESHHAKATTYEPTLQYFNPKSLVGMTATPDRMDWKDIHEIFGPPAVSFTLEEAMRKGWLTPVDYRLVTENVDQEALERLLERLSNPEAHVTSEEANQLIFKKKSLEENLDHLTATVGGKQTAVMCDSIEEAEQAAFILRQRGYLAEAMHSKSDEDDEELDRFRTGTTQFICAVNMLNEGIDVPQMGAVAFLRPTDSKTIFLQQLGRVLRKYPGKEKALVLDYVGSIERLDIINQIMREIKSGEEEQKDETYFDTTFIGGENVFTFDDKVVSKLSEILKRNERRYATYEKTKEAIAQLGLKNKFDYREARKKDQTLPPDPERAFGKQFQGWHAFLNADANLNIMTFKQAQKFIKDEHITTYNQYAIYAQVIFPDKRRLPSFQELQKNNKLSDLGLKNFNRSKVSDDDVGWISHLQDQYTDLIVPLPHGGGLWYRRYEKLLVKGISNYEITEADKKDALDELVAIAHGEKENLVRTDYDKKWESLYRLETVEDEDKAKRMMSRFLNALQNAGLLTKEFFAPEIYHPLCDDLIYNIVDPDGNKGDALADRLRAARSV